MSVNLLVVTLDEARLDAIVATITVLRALVVHLVALRVGGPAGGAPQELTLVVVGPAGALIAEGLPHAARFPVHLEHIRGTVFALAGAVFRQVALVLGAPALRAGALRPAGLQVAALAGGAARVVVQHAAGRVATGIVAVLLQAAVALLARLDEAVAAYRAVEELLRLISEAIVHAVFEGQCQMLERTRGPVRRPVRAAG